MQILIEVKYYQCSPAKLTVAQRDSETGSFILNIAFKKNAQLANFCNRAKNGQSMQS